MNFGTISKSRWIDQLIAQQVREAIRGRHLAARHGGDEPPSGVGAGRGLYLRGGDVVRVTIDGLGTLENTVIDPTEETS